ncbi:MAG: T9SS type A sorting domain-containing protein [Bacteroidetes bacterium]|nr:T9SS type A sorting domain-containing protein [Bacteroidota bacterium]
MSQRSRFLRHILLFVILCAIPPSLCAQEEDGDIPASWKRLTAGNMELTISRFGQVAFDAEDGGMFGLFWPGAPLSADRRDRDAHGLVSGATPVLVGTVRGELRASASYYRDTFLPGPIENGLRTVPPEEPYYRPYVISIDRPGERDYRDWPAGLGAPIHAFREPYFYGARQMYWVMNDLDSVLMRQYMGSDPMGVEIRCLAYGPFGSGTLNEDYLILQFTYINQSADTIRDAYTGFFADADIRDGMDDLPGSDSARALVYAYDRSAEAGAALGMPTAFGVCMLQTPVVPGEATDSARWEKDWRHGFRNLSISAAVIPVKWDHDDIGEPPFGIEGPARWLALMQGRGEGTSVRNPLTGAPSRFWFSGDPVQDTGWLPRDGYLLGDGSNVMQAASDQRLLISSGPFTLAPEDTQQVVIALIAARGATPQAAVHMLRDRAEYLRARHLQHPAVAGLSGVSVNAAPQKNGTVAVRISASGDGPQTEMEAELSRPGEAPVRAALQRTQVGSGWVHAASINRNMEADGINVSLLARENENAPLVRVPGRVSVPLAGDISIEGTAILQEGDGNGRISPDEDAHWYPRLHNGTNDAVTLFLQHADLPVSQWMATPEFKSGQRIPSDDYPWLPAYGHRTVWTHDARWGRLFDTVTTDYDAWSVYRNSWWKLRGRIPVDSSAGEWYDVLMTQIRGGSNERPGVRILEPNLLEDRWYVVSVHGTADDNVLAMKDSATGIPYFTGWGVDRFTGTAPGTDGFRVVRGTIAPWKWSDPHYGLQETRDAPSGDFGFSAERIGAAVQPDDAWSDVLLVMDSSSGQSAWQYRGGTILAEPAELPLRVYRRGYDRKWQQVEIGLFETSGAETYGSWNGGRHEGLLVFEAPLGSEWAPPSTLPPYFENLPGLCFLQAKTVPDIGSYEFMYHIPVSEEDLFVFNPRHALLARSNTPAVAATLHPPAPMPFSDWTSAVIELPEDTPLRAEVFDALGRRVQLLRDEYVRAGRYLLIWDGRWQDGRPADAGMYLLRVVAGGGEVTRKLVVVR